MREQWRAALRATYLFADLEDAVLEALEAFLEEKEVIVGEHLTRQGDAAESLFIIVEGQVEIYMKGTDAKAPRRLGPGSVLGEVSVALGGKRSASVCATVPTRVLIMRRASFERLLEQRTDVAGPLARLFAERVRRERIAHFMRDLFGALDPETLATLERHVAWVRIDRGRELFGQGDEPDGAYLVVAGRLRVCLKKADGGEQVIDETSAGQWVGEMALLTGAKRSATVYAMRDTDLMRLSQEAFDLLITTQPRALQETTRVLVSRMQRQMSGDRKSPVVKTLAIVPAREGVDVTEFAREVVATLRRYGTTIHLTADEVDKQLGATGSAQSPVSDAAHPRISPWLMEQEEAHRFVVYQGDDVWSPWTERAVRYADHVLIVAVGRLAPDLGANEQRLAAFLEGGRAPKQSLVLLQDGTGDSFRGTSHWLTRRRVDTHFHVRRGVKDDVPRLVRTVIGKAVTLVLGGGGSRGYAHIGVLRAFQELGVPIDGIAGTSIGSLIGASHAFGVTWREMIADLPPRLVRGFTNVTLPVVSLLSGKVVMDGLEEGLGTLDIEDLATPFFCVSTNLTRGGEVIHRRGGIAMAVRASTSIPGIFPPVPHGGDLLVDGGVSNNVPVDVMFARFGGAVVAVDIMPDVDLRASGELPASLSGWTVAGRRLNPFAEKVGMPDILSILIRSATAASHGLRRAEESAKLASLYLRPPLTMWNIVDFKTAAPVAEEGYRGTYSDIASWWTLNREGLTGRAE